MSSQTKAKHARLVRDLVRASRLARTASLKASLIGAASALARATWGRPLRLVKHPGYEAAMLSIAPHRKEG